jgi:hypothetical protein
MAPPREPVRETDRTDNMFPGIEFDIELSVMVLSNESAIACGGNSAMQVPGPWSLCLFQERCVLTAIGPVGPTG